MGIELCSCKNKKNIGFYGVSSIVTFKETVARYGFPLAESLYCSDCRKELPEDDPRSTMGLVK